MSIRLDFEAPREYVETAPSEFYPSGSPSRCKWCWGAGVIEVTDQNKYKALRLCECKKRKTAMRKAEALKLPADMAWHLWDEDKTRIQEIIGDRRKTVEATTLQKWTPAGGDGLYIVGDTRVGKSHAIAAMARDFIFERGVAALYVNMKHLFSQEKKAIDNPTKVRPIERAIQAPLLFADDLGINRPSAWFLEQLYDLVDGRIRAKLPTVWTSNLTLNHLANYLSKPSGKAEEKQHALQNATRIHARIVEAATRVFFFSEPKG